MTASATLALTVWFAESLRPRVAAPDRGAGRLRLTATLILCGLFLQLGLGALVAGLRAGKIYNEWPLMGGHVLPPASELWAVSPWWRNVFETATTAQFDHRTVAYLLLIAVIAHAVDARRTAPGHEVARSAAALALAVVAQASIGIATLLWSVPLGAALLHQGFAMIVLALAVSHRAGLRHPATRHLVQASGETTREIIGLPGFAADAR